MLHPLFRDELHTHIDLLATLSMATTMTRNSYQPEIAGSNRWNNSLLISLCGNDCIRMDSHRSSSTAVHWSFCYFYDLTASFQQRRRLSHHICWPFKIETSRRRRWWLSPAVLMTAMRTSTGQETRASSSSMKQCDMCCKFYSTIMHMHCPFMDHKTVPVDFWEGLVSRRPHDWPVQRWM